MDKILGKITSKSTQGELKVHTLLTGILKKHPLIYCYFEPTLGDNAKPDFLVLSPHHGVLLIEVKDYKSQNLKNVPKDLEWEMEENGFTRLVTNPFDQIYRYFQVTMDLIRHCKLGTRPEVPLKRFVVFSKISKDSEAAKLINQNCPSQIFLFYKEDLGGSQFEERFFAFFPAKINLSEIQFNTLRGNFIPISRLPHSNQKKLSEFLTPEDKVKLLDARQEQIARSLGSGHRLVFGVAGSGKTVMLLARARYLAGIHPEWHILVVCYNRLLMKYLQSALHPQDFEADIQLNTFHGWIKSYLQSEDPEYHALYQQAFQKAVVTKQESRFFREFVPKLLLNHLKNLDDTQIVHYDAILIDEAQDFEADWLRCLVQVLNPTSNSLFIACDGVQGIYARKKFYWSDVGIQARGRVRKFRKSYRTPGEIGEIAQAILPANITDFMEKYDEFLITEEYETQVGYPELILAKSRTEEVDLLVKRFQTLLKAGAEIFVLFRQNLANKNYQHPLIDKLNAKNIPWRSLNQYNYHPPALLIGTLHGTKGLEAEIIVLPELDTINTPEDRQLLYVGMTRARQRLILSASKETKFVSYLATLGKLKKPEA